MVSPQEMKYRYERFWDGFNVDNTKVHKDRGIYVDQPDVSALPLTIL